MKKSDNYSTIVDIERGQIAVAQLIRATTDSVFTLTRGVSPFKGAHKVDYLWSDVMKDGKTVQLTLNTNPIILDVPGTYRLRNDGTDDEMALVDITTY